MGQSFYDSLIKMKFIVVLALAAMAMAEPEADADAWYGYYGYGLRPYATGYRTYGYGYGYPYRYYGKRSADAEPEAEADPALLYTTSAVHTPLTSAVHTPLTYVHHSPLLRTLVPTVQTAPVVTKTVQTTPVVKTVSTPLVYNTLPLTHHVAGVYSGLPLAHHVYTGLPVHSVNNVPVVKTEEAHTVAKREAEAEADPALLYTTSAVHTPLTYVNNVVPAVQTVQTAPVVKSVSTPLVYNTVPVAHSVVPATYTHHVAAPAVLPVATVHKAADHGVVATYAGLVHSSHVGICLNNQGQQVQC